MNNKKKNSVLVQKLKDTLIDVYFSAKNINIYGNEKNNFIIKSPVKDEKRKKSEKIFMTKKENSENTTYIEDRPKPEKMDEKIVHIIKNILFGKINIKNNEREILKLLSDCQEKADKIKDIQKQFFIRQDDIYNSVMDLKENIAYYSFIFHLYIKSSQIDKAKEFFLLMDKHNRELIKAMSKLIKKGFKKMRNDNRIGKYSPLIIKAFCQILSIMIKLSSKCNKTLIEDYYLEMYRDIMFVIRETMADKFKSVNNDLENDFKLIARFFYNDCLNKMAIYFLYRYQPFDLVTILLQTIIKEYHKEDISYLINSEHLLLLKINYNLGLLYYVEGKNKEAITYINKAKARLRENISFPYVILKDNFYNITKKSPLPRKNYKISSDYNNCCPDRSSINSFNIDENFDKYVAGNCMKKRSISSRVSGDLFVAEKKLEPCKVFCSNIMFGKNKYIDKEQVRFINDCIYQKIEVEIELILSEIELGQKNFEESFAHANKIINILDPLKKHTFLSKKLQKFDNNSTLNDSYLKRNDFTKTSYSNNVITNSFNTQRNKYSQPVSEANRRHLAYILESIDNKDKNKKNDCMDSTDKMKAIIFYDSISSSKTDRIEYDKRLNENINRERTISLEAEKFFIFICGLSFYQLKILNEFQPEPSRKRDDLPILFPNQFKDCLTFSQRLALNNLDTMSLSRYIILKDSNKDISPENLDYVFLSKKIKSSHKNSIIDSYTSRDSNNQYINNMLKQFSKNISTDSPDSSMECSGDKRVLTDRNIKNNNIFDKDRFQKFVEEDKIFNQRITEITKNDKNNFLEKNRNKILKTLHSLQWNEKELLMSSSQNLKQFLKKIETKMKMTKRKYKEESFSSEY